MKDTIDEQKHWAALGSQIKAMRNKPRGPMLEGRKVGGLELAEAIGFSAQSAISTYEIGNRPIPLRVMKQICSYLGYEFEEVLPKDPSARQHILDQWGIDDPAMISRENPSSPLSMGMTESNTLKHKVKVMFAVKMQPGEYKPAERIAHLSKHIPAAPSEFSPTAFAVVQFGTGLGEILEHEQPLIVDYQTPRPGDLCLLEKDKHFMLVVFESESAFGKVFRQKGSTDKTTVTNPNEIKILKVLSIKNPSDVQND